MTLTELQAEVVTLTNRADLVAETLLAVRRSTLALHQADFWWRDLQELGLNFPSWAYRQTLDLTTFCPQFRALKYLKNLDCSTDTSGDFTVVDPVDLVDTYHVLKENICYAAGNNLHIRSSTEFRNAVMGYYKNPDVTVDCYSSWIADHHPYAIVFKAAGTVFKMIGKTDEFTAYNNMALEEQRNILITNTQVQGA